MKKFNTWHFIILVLSPFIFLLLISFLAKNDPALPIVSRVICTMDEVIVYEYRSKVPITINEDGGEWTIKFGDDTVYIDEGRVSCALIRVNP
jgi:hypothetical protein